MLRILGRLIGLITEWSTAPVAHEAQRDSGQEAKSDISAPESKTQLVLAARPGSSFHRYLDLPPDLLALVAIFWDQKDLHQFNRALVGFYNHHLRTLPPAAPGGSTAVVTYQPMGTFLHRQFKVVPRQARLLQAVIDADYSQAQAAVDQDLSLMFKSMNCRYRDGNSEYISPLKYAFKVYDTYMWKLFYEKIKKNPEQVKEFLKQAQEPIRHLDLEPLFAVYEAYEVQCQLWLAGKITEEKIAAAWLKLGAAQQRILPVHMLKEFSREGGGDTWSVNSAFDVTAMPPPPSYCQIYDGLTGTWRALSSIISDQGWGSSFSLVRGGATTPFFTPPLRTSDVGPWLKGAPGVEIDLAIFRRLFEIRAEDLAKQISLLSQKSHTSPELLGPTHEKLRHG